MVNPVRTYLMGRDQAQDTTVAEYLHAKALQSTIAHDELELEKCTSLKEERDLKKA